MLWIVIGTIAIVVVSITAGLYLDRRFGLLPRREKLQPPKPALPAHADGEAPATAIYATRDTLERLRERACRKCKAPMRSAEGEPVVFEGRELLVLPFTCPRCGAHDRRYVEPAPE